MDLQDTCKARSIGVTSNGKMIAVGHVDGTIRIFYNENPKAGEYKLQFLFKDSERLISDIKFSPDNSIAAVGAHDAKIYLYNIVDNEGTNNKKWIKKAAMKKHSSSILHLDFSCDGSRLHSNCGAYELLFWDVNNAAQITSGATQLRDETWATFTCVLGWPVSF